MVNHVILQGIPHVCGDEPANNRTREIIIPVYPTYVGMNR